MFPVLMSSKLSEVRRKKAQTLNQSLSKLAADSGGESTYLTLDNYIARNRVVLSLWGLNN